MKKIILSVLMCCVAMIAAAQVERPKLVVGIVIDQMRWDYLYYYYDKYGEGGMKRLINEGFSCENQMINYLPTVPALDTQACILVPVLPLTALLAIHSIRTASLYIAATTKTSRLLALSRRLELCRLAI